MEIVVDTIIIGGGFSGLFLAEGFIKSGYNSFLLSERNKKHLGGHAISGGIKVGLLPAGEKTKRELHLESYKSYQETFLRKYKKFLINPRKRNIQFDFQSAHLINKYYHSYIMKETNAKIIAALLYESIKEKIVFSSVCKIDRSADGYYVHFSNNTTVICKNIIIATGRDRLIVSILENIGQLYINKDDYLFGCRVTFPAESAEKIYNYQPDFKIKNNDLYQTYCFNYRGKICSYIYNGYKIYAGALNENSKTGNCFIGSRKNISPDTILKNLDQPFKVRYKQFSNMKLPKIIAQDSSSLCNFIDNFENVLNLKINTMYFPALEQFWPKPVLKTRILESQSLPNVYFIGDASGIAFGFLQCYITANYLIECMRKNNVFH